MSFGDHFQISTGLLNQALRCGLLFVLKATPQPPYIYFDRVNEIIMNINHSKLMDVELYSEYFDVPTIVFGRGLTRLSEQLQTVGESLLGSSLL